MTLREFLAGVIGGAVSAAISSWRYGFRIWRLKHLLKWVLVEADNGHKEVGEILVREIKEAIRNY